MINNLPEANWKNMSEWCRSHGGEEGGGCGIAAFLFAR